MTADKNQDETFGAYRALVPCFGSLKQIKVSRPLSMRKAVFLVKKRAGDVNQHGVGQHLRSPLALSSYEEKFGNEHCSPNSIQTLCASVHDFKY
jgi:hypothetical protein